MPENKPALKQPPMDPAAKYILDSLANPGTAKPRFPGDPMPYINRPLTPAERAGNPTPVMTQGPKQFDTYEQWLRATPPENRRYAPYGGTWVGLTPDESARLWKDRNLDFFGQAFRSGLKVPTNLLGLATTVADKAYASGVKNSDSLTYPILRYGYKNKDPHLRKQLEDEAVAKAQEVRSKGGLITRPIRWWHNKIDEYTPELIDDPWPNETYTKVMQTLARNDQQYSNADINRHMGNLAGFLVGSYVTGKAMPQGVNRLFSIQDSPLLQQAGRPMRYLSNMLGSGAAAPNAGPAVKMLNAANKHMVKAVNRAGHGIRKVDSAVKVNPKAGYGLGIVPWANNTYSASSDSPLGMANTGVSLVTGGLEGLGQNITQQELQQYEPVEYQFADNQ